MTFDYRISAHQIQFSYLLFPKKDDHLLFEICKW